MTFTPVSSGFGALVFPAGTTAMGGLVLALLVLATLVVLGAGRGRTS